MFLLAVYGAALSTFNWRRASWREKRALRVDLKTISMPRPDGTRQATFEMTAVNTGHRPVNVTNMCLEVDRGARVFATIFAEKLPDSALPTTLHDGDAAKLHLTYKEVGEALLSSGRNKRTRIAAVCIDSAGGEHRSKRVAVDPDELINNERRLRHVLW